MADNIWDNSDADNDGNVAANWSLGWVPKAGDTMVFDGNVTHADCTLPVNVGMDIDALRTDNGYSGLVTADALNLRVAGVAAINFAYYQSANATRYLRAADFQLGASADIYGVGFARMNQPGSGQGVSVFTAGARIRNAYLEMYGGHASGTVIVPATYETEIRYTSGTARTYTLSSGSYSCAGLELNNIGAGDLTLDLATNDPTVTTQDLTFDIDSSGDVVISPGTNGLIVQGDVNDELTSTGVVVANSCPITGTGSSNRDWDGCGATWGATEIIVTGAATVTLVDDWTCSSFTLTDGDLDIGTNNITLTASGAVSFASGSTLADATGATVACDTISFDGQSVTGLTINASTSGTATGTTFANVTYNGPGGAELDASDGTCTDGGGNSGIDFGGAVFPPHLFQMAVA